MAERERAAVVTCAESLKRAGLPCPIVSVGSTPTATYAESMEGVTEVRAGKYLVLTLDESDEGQARARVEGMARQLLANDVIEDFHIDIKPESGGDS